jgi:branched-subunit amino acid transport protein
MSATWYVVWATSLVCFLVKYVGHVVPTSWLAHPRVQRINGFVPVVLLGALVAVQTWASKTHLGIDHRMAGLAVAGVALARRAPFPLVVLLAAATSALVYHLH